MGRAEEADTIKRRFVAAVEAVEAVSSVEIVVAVRSAAGSYTAVDLAVGGALAYAVLLFTLFAPPEFELGWIAALVAAAFVAGALFSRGSGRLRLALSGRQRVTREVERAARATFVERGVSVTRGRTGLLVFIAKAERRCAVIADIGVLRALPENTWRATRATIEGVLDGKVLRPAVAEALAAAIESTAPAFAEHLPRAADDINELEDVA